MGQEADTRPLRRFASACLPRNTSQPKLPSLYEKPVDVAVVEIRNLNVRSHLSWTSKAMGSRFTSRKPQSARDSKHLRRYASLTTSSQAGADKPSNLATQATSETKDEGDSSQLDPDEQEIAKLELMDLDRDSKQDEGEIKRFTALARPRPKAKELYTLSSAPFASDSAPGTSGVEVNPVSTGFAFLTIQYASLLDQYMRDKQEGTANAERENIGREGFQHGVIEVDGEGLDARSRPGNTFQ